MKINIFLHVMYCFGPVLGYMYPVQVPFVLLFLMIRGSSRRLLPSIAASFGVWGHRDRFLRSLMNVIQDI